MINIAIIASQYRKEISDNLVKSCIETLNEKGVSPENIKIYQVPGALEIPLIAKKLAKQKKFAAIIVFGSVFKGKTYHFEQVADECVKGCMKVSLEFEIPVIFEVLCVYDPQDAIDRSIGTKDNRGVEGAISALKMIELIKQVA